MGDEVRITGSRHHHTAQQYNSFLVTNLLQENEFTLGFQVLTA